jgi:hypothetical protein
MKSGLGTQQQRPQRALTLLQVASAVACVLLMQACKGATQAPRPTPARARGVARSFDVETPTTPAAQVPTTTDLDPTRAQGTPPTMAAAAAAEAATSPEKRDFAEEFRRKISGAVTCLKVRAADVAPAHIDIAVTAQVMPSGAVGRGEASASLLDVAELTCVRHQIEAVHFDAPIENAPFSVSATLSIDQAPRQPAAPGGSAAAPAAGL